MSCKNCGGPLVTVILNYGVCENCFTGYIIEEEKDDRHQEALEYYRKEALARGARYWGGEGRLGGSRQTGNPYGQKESSTDYVPEGYVQDG